VTGVIPKLRAFAAILLAGFFWEFFKLGSK